MSNKRWIWIGCGGCLGIIILCIVVAVVGFYWVGENFNQMISDMNALHTEIEALNEKYPFSKPDDMKIDPSRYQKFLKVRQDTINEAQERLDWFRQLIDDSNQSNQLSTFELIGKLINLIPTITRLGLHQVDALDKAEMAHREYAFYTGLSASETKAWLDAKEDSERKKAAQEYWKPLNDLERWSDKQQKENPSANTDLGPFDKALFIQAIEKHHDPDHSNADLIWQNRDDFFVSPYAIFVDALAVWDFYADIQKENQ